MNHTLHILIADYVPIANRGEEAIVRGIEDMLADDRPVALGLFDNVPQVTQRENITLFPRDWLFRLEGNPALSGLSRILLQASLALQLRLGIYGPLRNLVSPWTEVCRPLADFFDRARYVLVGHDGVFGVESCAIVHLARELGKRTGILGASTGLGGGRWYKAWLYRRTMEESDFCFFREPHSLASMKQVCSDPGKLRMAPDPAFAMQPASLAAAREVLERCEPCRAARQSQRPIIAVTALEKGRVYVGFRPDLQGRAKQQAHARYLAAILDTLIHKYQAFTLLLPHSVEAEASDLVAARHVVEQMKATPADYAILESDCGPRVLKSIMGVCDFLVGERTHSVIGSVSMGTPFAALTNRQDTRTHGIIGAMCRCEDQIIDMDVAGEQEAAQRIGELFETRDALRRSLGRIREELSRQIEETVRTIKGGTGRPS